MPDNNVKKLTKQDLIKSWLIWFFFHLSSMSYERLQAFGFCHSMIPLIKKLYDKKEDQIEALQRHSAFFYNTEPQLGAVVNGIVAGLEEAKANDKPVNTELINGIKVGLMGPIAGVGDSIVQGMLVPLLLSIGMGLAEGGNPIGPIFYIVTFIPIITFASYWLYMKGYNLGTDAVELLVSKVIKRLTEAFNILGITVMGGIAASYINMSTTMVYKSGDTVIQFQDLIDKIYPKLLPLLLVLITWYLMSKKGITPLKMMVMYLILATVGVLIGVF